MKELRSVARHAVGWHGKLPTVGDFATRRLDSNFVSVWDDWLSAGLARLRANDQVDWLPAYLASPTWRFLLTPGFLPAPLHARVWTGVLMPSVDRVGRYYPLTLASPLSEVPRHPDRQAALWSWLQRLQDAAIDALQEDWSIDALEAELLRLGLAPDPEPQGAESGWRPNADLRPFDPAAPASMQSFFAACSAPPTDRSGAGQCCWYNEADISAPRMVCSPGLDNSIARLWSE